MKRIPTFIALMAFLLMAGFLAIPFGAEAGASDVSVEAPTNHLLNVGLTNRAYSTELQNAQFTSFDLTMPQTLTNIAPFAAQVQAADFSADDSMIYALNQTAGTFVTIDPATGSQTEIGASVPMSGTWTGLATNTTSGMVYASSADCAADDSWLSTVNPVTGDTTMIGAISGTQCIQALAVDASGQLWGVDMELDQLFMIDSLTGAGTSVGVLGINASSVGLDVDYTTGTLYMTTLEDDDFESRFYSVDTGTGAATMVGALGSSTPGGFVELGWLAISGQLPLTCNGLSGVIPDNDSNGITNTITVTDSRYLIDLDVYLSTTHSAVGDLVFDLSYDGTTVSLLDRPNNGAGDCTGDNLDITLDDEAAIAIQNSCANADPAYSGASYQPSDSLSAFDLLVYNGTWSLNAIDGAAGETGSLNCWSLEPTFAEPGITLEKTVSTDGSCGTESEISVVAGTEVTYCYTVTNVGNITLTNHDLDDSELGTLLTDFAYDLGIGESVSITDSATITTDTTNDATWEAEIPLGPSASADASATVTVIPPTCSAPNVAIPDAISAGVTDTLTFTDTGILTDLDVLVMSEHTWVGDLSYTLTHLESGTSVTIIDRPGVPATANGCSGDDIDATLDDEATDPVEDACDAGTPTIDGDFTPNNPLSLFDMMAVPLAGTWELNVSDAVSGESGTLTQWCLEATTGEPEIEVDPTSIDSTQAISTTTTHPLTITNSGDAVLTWDISSDVAWASVDTVSGTNDAGTSSNLVVSFDSTGLAVDTYTGTLTIDSNDADEPTVNVSLTLTVEEAGDAHIAVDPTSLASTLNPDQSEDQTLTISNNGDADLIWTIEEEAVGLVQPYRSMNTSKLAASTEVGTPTGNNSFSASSATNVESFGQQPLNRDGPTTITHSASQDIVAGNSVACRDNATNLHTDNSYIRVFNMDDFGLGDFNITNVEFGVENATGATGSQPVEVNLYTLDGALSFANMTLIGRAVVDLPDQALTIASVDVTGFVPAGSILVVEVFTPNGVTDGNNFSMGSNADGQTAPTYLAAAGCGIEEPTDIADIGFPDMQIVMNVTGIPDGDGPFCTPADLGWVSVDPTGGTTAPPHSDDVTVTFDSTGLADGNYDGNLCVSSNDSAKPIVIVPVMLTVQTPSNPDPLMCNGPTIEFEAGIPTDWITANSGNVYWSTTNDLAACDNEGNQTNGSGQAACADSDQTNNAGDPYSAELWTNAFDIDAQWDSASLNFEAAYRDIGTADMFEVDISTDGGANWDNLLSWDEDHRDPGEAVSLDLSAYTGQTGLIVRYHYFGEGWDWWAQVDDVSLNCVELPPVPDIDVTPTELASTQPADTQVDETLTISNTGDAELTWDITIDVDWASVDMMNGTTAAGGSSDVTVTFDSTDVEPGTYTGTLSIDSNDPDEPTVDVALTLTVEAEPEADAEVEIPAIMLKAGQDLTQTMSISNTGDVDFNWEAYTEETTGLHTAGACSGTLDPFPGTTLDPTSGMTAAGDSSDVTMNTDTSNVDPGDYTGNVCLTITESGQVIAIPLTMTVTEPTAVEMAELTTSTSSNLPLALAVAGMMLVLAGGVVVHRRRRQ